MTLEFLIFVIIAGIIIGQFAFIFIQYLIEQGEVFDFYPAFVLKVITGKPIVNNINNLAIWRQKMLKILLFCPKCFAGQLALWSYFIIFRDLEYNTFFHFVFITSAIFSALYLSEKTFV